LYQTGPMGSGGGRSGLQTWRFVATSAVEDGETVLRLEGRLGHEGAALLKRAGEGVLDRGVVRLALDLAAVDYVSSAGVRTIEELATALEERSGRLRLLNATDPVRIVLDLSGLMERLTKNVQL
jgi:anti-anti-sigma factor